MGRGQRGTTRGVLAAALAAGSALTLAGSAPAQPSGAAGAAGPAGPSETAPSADPTRVRPGRYRLDPEHGRITWSVSHLGYSTFYGQFAEVTGTAVLDPREPARSALDVTVDLAALRTLVPALDAQLRGPGFLDVEHFPSARFLATRVEPTGPTTARVTGDLTLRGTTRPVTFDATFNQAGVHPVDGLYTAGFDGRAVLRRSAFGVSALLPGLGDEVTLRLEGEFKLME